MLLNFKILVLSIIFQLFTIILIPLILCHILNVNYLIALKFNHFNFLTISFILLFILIILNFKHLLFLFKLEGLLFIFKVLLLVMFVKIIRMKVSLRLILI